jgi:hypothetical protein
MNRAVGAYRYSQEAKDHVRIDTAKLRITLDRKLNVKTPEWVIRLAAGDTTARPPQKRTD